MMRFPWMSVTITALIVMSMLTPMVSQRVTADEADNAAAQRETATSDEAAVRVGKVVLGDGGVSGSEMDVCFSAGFLTTFARETGVRLHRSFERIHLGHDRLFDYPFLVLAGQGAFTLTEAEGERLRAYVRRGGFVLASAGCSNAAWAASFREVAEAWLGADALEPLTTDHAIFHTLYEIDQVDVRAGDPREAVQGYEVDGVVRLIFSPVGLNETDRAGDGCCCCGGNEVRNARLINANILAYALTH